MTPLEIKIANSDIYFMSNALSASLKLKFLDICSGVYWQEFSFQIQL